MASEFATTLSKKLTHGVPEDVLQWGRRIIDGELKGVREVLTQLAEWPFPVGKPCWCHLEGEHSDACERARALYQRLRVDGGKGE